MKRSNVPQKGLNQSHATFMPDAAQAVSRFPLDLSWCRDSHQFWRRLYVFDSSSDGSLALVFLIHKLSRLAEPFPQRSLPWLLTTAAWGALKPAPASRLRGIYPHLLCSYAHFMKKCARGALYWEYVNIGRACDILLNIWIAVRFYINQNY